MYIEKLDNAIRRVKRKHKSVIISGDFNAKWTAWGRTNIDKNGRILSEVVNRNQLAPIWAGKSFHLSEGNHEEVLDIMSVRKSYMKRHKRTIIPPVF